MMGNFTDYLPAHIAALDSLRTLHARFVVEAGGLKGSAESWIDVVTGRFRDEFELGPVGGANGFDGAVAWSQDSSGQARVENSQPALEAARNEAYRRSFSYLFHRIPGETVRLGMRCDGVQSFEVVRVAAGGGRPFELWFDRETHLLVRIAEQERASTRITTLSDYRVVDGIPIPFRTRESRGDQAYDSIATIVEVHVNSTLPDGVFEIPTAPPDFTPPDFAIRDTCGLTEVPFQLIDNHIYVDVNLNGQGPFAFLCDTGGANSITPELAARLNLPQLGRFPAIGVGEQIANLSLCRIASTEVSSAELRDQAFLVLPLDFLAQTDGVAASGILGHELFQRFVVRIDYERLRLTLWDPREFRPGGAGVSLPFRFRNATPEIEGVMDGVPGVYTVDTGSRAALTLSSPFVAKHDLVARYGARFEAVVGWGVGGSSLALLARGGVLHLGAVEIRDFPLELSLDRSGALAEPDLAGSIGGALLKRFHLTFDSRNRTITFEPNPNGAHSEAFDRSGMWLHAGDDHFLVAHVIAGGPADRAGIQAGDRMVEISGKPAGAWKLGALRQRFRTERPGSQVEMKIVRDGFARIVELTLADLV